MSLTETLRFRAREWAKGVLSRNMHRLGRQVLLPDQVSARYPGFAHSCAPALVLKMPPVFVAQSVQAPEMVEETCPYEATSVYRFPRSGFKRMEILSNGGLLFDGKFIPHTGVGEARASVIASWRPRSRLGPGRTEKLILLPWPQLMAVTYGDFVDRVLPRICRLVSQLSAAEIGRAVIAFPMAHQPWESAFLEQLGFTAERCIDTRTVHLHCASDGMVLANSGETGDWCRRGAHPDDYGRMRNALLTDAQRRGTLGRRIYLRRQGHRRVVLNERELESALGRYSFETVDPGTLSLDEQIATCAEASIIFGVHGANLANMVWCPPGATFIELFNRGFRPTFHRHMAAALGLRYFSWAEVPMEESSFNKLNWDLNVSVENIDKMLAQATS